MVEKVEKEKLPFLVYARRIMKNPLLNRKQMVIDVVHPKRANVSKEELEGKLAERFKTKKGCCVVYGLKTTFGGSKSSGFALVYDNEEYRHKYDSIPHLRKLGLKPKKGVTRKLRKDLKIKRKKVRGKDKAKQTATGGSRGKKPGK